MHHKYASRHTTSEIFAPQAAAEALQSEQSDDNSPLLAFCVQFIHKETPDLSASQSPKSHQCDSRHFEFVLQGPTSALSILQSPCFLGYLVSLEPDE